MKVWTLVCALTFASVGAQAGIITSWGSAYDAGLDQAQLLANSVGARLSTDDLLVQVVVDVDGFTDVQGMIDSGMLNVGSETGLGGVYAGSADDVAYNAVSFGTWEYNATFTDYEGSGGYDVDEAYGTKNFYLRWFNSTSQGSATEAGFIYHTSAGWAVPATSDSPSDPVVADWGAPSVAGSTWAADENGGWATVAAVPEPGMLGLLAVGLMTLVARRKRKA